jgi:hypothetical protein
MMVQKDGTGPCTRVVVEAGRGAWVWAPDDVGTWGEVP